MATHTQLLTGSSFFLNRHLVDENFEYLVLYFPVRNGYAISIFVDKLNTSCYIERELLATQWYTVLVKKLPIQFLKGDMKNAIDLI